LGYDGDLDGLLVDMTVAVAVALVGAIAMAVGRLDAHTLLVFRVLLMAAVQTGQKLVIDVVGEGVAERVFVGELLGNVARVGPRGVGRVDGAAAGGSGSCAVSGVRAGRVAAGVEKRGRLLVLIRAGGERSEGDVGRETRGP
jgi:hypothetical protein